MNQATTTICKTDYGGGVKNVPNAKIDYVICEQPLVGFQLTKTCAARRGTVAHLADLARNSELMNYSNIRAKDAPFTE